MGNSVHYCKYGNSVDCRIVINEYVDFYDYQNYIKKIFNKFVKNNVIVILVKFYIEDITVKNFSHVSKLKPIKFYQDLEYSYYYFDFSKTRLPFIVNDTYYTSRAMIYFNFCGEKYIIKVKDKNLKSINNVGGYFLPNENAFKCIKREIFEEISLNITNSKIKFLCKRQKQNLIPVLNKKFDCYQYTYRIDLSNKDLITWIYFEEFCKFYKQKDVEIKISNSEIEYIKILKLPLYK